MGIDPDNQRSHDKVFLVFVLETHLILTINQESLTRVSFFKIVNFLMIHKIKNINGGIHSSI